MAHGSKNQTSANSAPSNGVVTGSNGPGSVSVNRKKQKRRAKQAARQAAEYDKQGGGARNGHSPHLQSPLDPSKPHPQDILEYGDSDADDGRQYDEEGVYDSEDDPSAYLGSYDAVENDHFQSTAHPPNAGMGKKSKKKKKSKVSQSQDPTIDLLNATHPPPPPSLQTPPALGLSEVALKSGNRNANARGSIWNTSTSEERERIKEFWLELGEEERKSLVKIEKEAVLKKMKEQQKHSCSCTVCGRKRTAIEEELEVLYDAYYDELESYANQQQGPENGAPALPPPRQYAAALSRLPSDRIPSLISSHPSSRGRVRELAEEDDEDEDDVVDYDDISDDADDDYSDDLEDDLPPGPAADFFNFGNSLTVKGGILTVADDLLKNDGKKFIEMMEQLAERRMQREEEAQYAATGLAHNIHGGHNHGLPPEEDEYDEEDDEEFAESVDEDYEEDPDEMDTMTEEQRMEEGRRMFQIFAARMFEQRVLTAYKEKVARERQAKLLEELEEESRQDVQREAKKARDAQKKKDKKAQQRQAKAEERARREAEEAEKIAATKALEEKKQEDLRRKKEEHKKKKEMERKAQEDERQKKESEKLRRQQEEKDRQQEAERKIREQRAQEKKVRDEAKRREREEREIKEKEAREKKMLEDKARKDRDARAKKDQEARVKADREARERHKIEEHATHISSKVASSSKRATQPVPVAVPPGLHHKPSSSGIASPQIPVATPAIPKAPTPNRPRQSSQQGSHGSSPKTPQVGLGSAKAMSPSTSAPQPPGPSAPKTILQKPLNPQSQSAFSNTPPLPHHQTPTSPMQPIAPPPGMPPIPGAGFGALQPAMNGFAQNHGHMLPPLGQRVPLGAQGMPGFPQASPISSQLRHFGQQSSIPAPMPGMNGPPLTHPGRGFPPDAPPGFGPPLPGIGAQPQSAGFTRDQIQSHSRQQSASQDKANIDALPAPVAQAQPIARPAPIQRPSSVKPQEVSEEDKAPANPEIEDLSKHLGSSALLDDADDPLPGFASPDASARRGSIPAGRSRGLPIGFGNPAPFGDPSAQSRLDAFGISGPGGGGSTWNTPIIPFNPIAGSSGWGSSPTAAPFGSAFGVFGGNSRPSMQPASLRKLVCQSCKDLKTVHGGLDGHYSVGEILRQVEQFRSPSDSPLQLHDILGICDTIGDANNGGGMFHVMRDSPDNYFVRFDEDALPPQRGPPSGLGEIGSPLGTHSTPVGGFSVRPW